ncbi:hypothetical protein KKE26_03995 [bacterium]|nr:hypothetical protein [bacterium]MBU1753222.1 hypothetical protein [bacterium]
MRIDKSLEEVWDWKEKIYQETKGISMEEIVKKTKENALRINKRYELDLEIVNIRKSR